MRKSWDEHFLNIASEVASMGTCTRRQVGCVLVARNNKIISTGFNGVPPTWEHCRDNPNSDCPAKNAPSGTMLDGCHANHAEQNALLQCGSDDKLNVHTAYVTASPCVTCVKELLHTACCRVVFLEEYTQPEAKSLWTRTSVLIRTRAGVIADHRTWEIFTKTCHHPGTEHSKECCEMRGIPRTLILSSSGLR